MRRTAVSLPAASLATLALLLAGCSDADRADSPAIAGPSLTAPASPSLEATPGPTLNPRPVETPVDPLTPRPALESAPPLGVPTCLAEDLSMVDADALVTPQVVQEVYVLRTTGPDCQLQGYPAIQLLDQAGRPLSVRVSRGGYGLDVDEDGPVTLSRGTSLSFLVASSRDGSCTPTSTLVATLPGAGGPLRTQTFLQVCGGAVGISPVGRLADDHGDSG